MGTRGAFGVRIDGQDKITYNHWDSYPSALGIDFMDAVKTLMLKYGLEGLREKARGIRVIAKGCPAPTAQDIDRYKELLDTNVSLRSVSDWYCLLRGLQGDLEKVFEYGVIQDSAAFLKYSLFCEWAYILNLDEGAVEVYQGFQDKPHKQGRYASETTDDEYYPVALVLSAPANNIPEDWQETVDPPEDDK